MIHDSRIKVLNRNRSPQGDYILYWMQASQRTEYNHALEYAVRCANSYRKPLVVFFGLTECYPSANKRHYHFMLQGLMEVKNKLADRGIRLVLRRVSPEVGAAEMAKRALLVVTDRGYLRHQREWRKRLADSVDCPLVQVETDTIIPV